MIPTEDERLINDAQAALLAVPPNDEIHTVAAAARSRDGRVFAGVNLFHFTGGPCAELVVIGAAAAAGVLAADLTTMVAVRKDDQGNAPRVINPCGRCRQVLLDLNPHICVIVVDAKGSLETVGVRDLLPFAYVYEDSDGPNAVAGVSLA